MVLFMPRDAASVPVSRQVLDSCLETLGVTPDTRTDIALALGEACANVVQHAGPGFEYEVRPRPGTGGASSRWSTPWTAGPVPAAAALGTPSADPVPATAEHGRGLKIIDAVTDNLQLTGTAEPGPRCTSRRP